MSASFRLRISMSEETCPKVGTSVYIRKDGKILLSKRTGSNDPGTWCPPGGHLEMNESWEECVLRETREEAGIEIENIRFITVTNDIWTTKNAHYITLCFVANWKSGEPSLAPDEIEEWGWFAWEALPEPLFFPTKQFVKTGYNPLTL